MFIFDCMTCEELRFMWCAHYSFIVKDANDTIWWAKSRFPSDLVQSQIPLKEELEMMVSCMCIHLGRCFLRRFLPPLQCLAHSFVHKITLCNFRSSHWRKWFCLREDSECMAYQTVINIITLCNIMHTFRLVLQIIHKESAFILNSAISVW